MVLYGLVEILKLKSKPLMNGRGYVVGNGRGYGVIQNNESVSDQGGYRAARAAKKDSCVKELVPPPAINYPSLTAGFASLLTSQQVLMQKQLETRYKRTQI